MRKVERESLARVQREVRLIQRAIDVLDSPAIAYHWLTTPCAALRGKAPRDIHYDVEGARRVAAVLRRRAERQRAVISIGLDAFEDETTLGRNARCCETDGRRCCSTRIAVRAKLFRSSHTCGKESDERQG